MRGRRTALGWVAGLSSLLMLSGCVTVAEYRKLERRVNDLQGAPRSDSSRSQLADLSVQLDELEREVDRLRGGIEVAQHQAEQALKEARAARMASEASANPSLETGETLAVPDASGPAAPEAIAVNPSTAAAPPGTGASSSEVEAYAQAYRAWKDDEARVCIDRFREFLQAYPSSAFADDAAYWMADCYFKQGDFKTAILRFDDVVARHPAGNKAADALYRQGEALLRLGPGYAKAAGRAFERVVNEYPDSARAVSAKRQLELLGSG